MKLYRVEIVKETVILAESEEQIRKNINHYLKEIDDGASCEITTSEIFRESQLPKEWDIECRPWGERDPYDRTIKQILKDVKD